MRATFGKIPNVHRITTTTTAKSSRIKNAIRFCKIGLRKVPTQCQAASILKMKPTTEEEEKKARNALRNKSMARSIGMRIVSGYFDDELFWGLGK